jgi:hypothetical protein
MIDYLWGWGEPDVGLMRHALLDARPNADPATVTVIAAGGGTLVTIGEAYPGFKTMETDEHLLMVLGGPKPRHSVNLESAEADTRYTNWLSRQLSNNVDGLPFDVVGGFQIFKINKVEEFVEIVTDAASFVPCYATDAFKKGGPVGSALCGSHADAVAIAGGFAETIDPVSVADFLMHQTVTYPYTMYPHVYQLAPAHRMESRNGIALQATPYWLPEEKGVYQSIKAGARDLEKILTQNVEASIANERAVTVLMSGGEDSRVILCALPSSVEKRAVTVTDFFNHEARVAHKVSKKLGAEWQLVERSPTHYLDHAEVSIKLGESHNFFYHAHFNGLEADIRIDRPILGGLMADAFCKGSHIKKIGGWSLNTLLTGSVGSTWVHPLLLIPDPR